MYRTSRRPVNSQRPHSAAHATHDVASARAVPDSVAVAADALAAVSVVEGSAAWSWVSEAGATAALFAATAGVEADAGARPFDDAAAPGRSDNPAIAVIAIPNAGLRQLILRRFIGLTVTRL
jgi:hypothetical protein